MKVYKIIIFIILNFFIFFSTVQSKYIFVSNENSDTITVLNKDKKIIKTIKTGGRPRDMKFSLDNTLLYVVVSEENHIAIIDINSLKIIDYIKSGDDPEIFDISPDGKLIAVSNEDDNEITLIDVKTQNKLATIENVGVEPEGVNFSKNGEFIYVTSEGTNSVVIINTKTREIVNEILVGNRPRRGLFIKDGNEYWVSNELSGSVTIIDTNNLKTIKNLYFSVKGIRDQNITPVDFAYSKKFDKIYVTLGSANHVAVVNGSNYNVEKYILAGSRVWGAALNNNDEELIVTNGNSDDISIIDLIKQTAVSSIPVGKTPHTVRVMK